ncbi:MAG TPA: PAS domain-containing protein, partial [Vicinamibacteria bacterium]
MDEGQAREESRREIDDLKAQLRELLDHLPDAFVETEVKSQRVVYLNRMAPLLFGYDAQDVAEGIPGSALFAESELEEVQRSLARYVAPSIERGVRYVKSGRQELLEFQMRRKDGSIFAAETQSSFVLDADGIPRKMRTIVRDVSARRELERRLEELSYRDPLTGCYNRRHL